MFFKTFKFKTLTFFLFFILFFTNNFVFACKCFNFRSIEKDFARAVVVFEGRIESVWPKLLLETSMFETRGILVQAYKFRIFRKWKGEIKGDSIVLYSTGSDCDSYFIAGHTYLVYATRDTFSHNRLTSNQCNGTDESNHAIEDYKFLGPGKIVSDPVTGFIPETKSRQITRHVWVYLLAGVWINRNFLPLIKASSDIVEIPYLLLLLHFVLLLVSWIVLHASFREKIPVYFLFSLICVLFSGLGTFFLKQSVFIGFSLNLLFLFIFSIYHFIKAKFKLAFGFLFLGICFTFLGLLVSGYFLLNDVIPHSSC